MFYTIWYRFTYHDSNAYCFFNLLRFVGGGNVGGEGETFRPRLKHGCSSAAHLVKVAEERSKGKQAIEWVTRISPLDSLLHT